MFVYEHIDVDIFTHNVMFSTVQWKQNENLSSRNLYNIHY